MILDSVKAALVERSLGRTLLEMKERGSGFPPLRVSDDYVIGELLVLRPSFYGQKEPPACVHTRLKMGYQANSALLNEASYKEPFRARACHNTA